MNPKKFIVLLSYTLLVISCSSNAKKQTSAVQQDPDQSRLLVESIERGEMLYTDFCMQCHMANGKGIEATFPPLAGSDWLSERRSESIHAVKYGLSGEIIVNDQPYNSVMVTMGLSDQEVADVLNYVMNSWGNSQEKMVTAGEVSEIKE